MIIDTEYIKAGLKAIKDNDKINIRKLSRDFSVTPKVIYNGISDKTTAETLNKLMAMIKYCEKNKLIELGCFQYQDRLQQRLNRMIEANQLINRIQKKNGKI